MEQNIMLYVSISVLVIILVSKLFKKSINLPPSPFPALPILGHLHLIKSPLHRTLDALSKKFGPIISLRFGSSLAVVVSSPAAVEECFTKNDVVLADRPRLTMGKYMGYNWSTMAGASYGDHWRNLRRISSLEIFSTSRLNSFLSIRRDEVNQLLLALSQNARTGFNKIVLKPNFNILSFNIVMRMIAGKRYYGEVVDDEEEARNVRKIIEEVLAASNSYPGDFLPFLKWIDYKNYQKRAAALSKKMDQILQGIIEEHRSGAGRNSMVDHLLSLQESQPDSHSDVIIKGLMVKSIHLPPSPFPRLPIIGHLYLIKEPLHRTLDALSKTIGPVLSLRFGSFLVVVVSSPAAVEECFTKNDIVLANRPRLILGEHMGYNWSTMVSVSYGDNWRNLRRLSAHEIFSTSRLNSFLSMRRDEVNQLLHGLSQNTRNEFGKVVLKPNLTDLAFNIIMRMIAGKRYFGEVVHDNEEAKHVRDVIEEVLSMAGASYPGDFLPFLSWIDYKNFKKRAFALFKKMDKLLQGIIEEHKNGEARNSMVAHLLCLQKSEPDSYSDIIIKGLMVVEERSFSQSSPPQDDCRKKDQGKVVDDHEEAKLVQDLIEKVLFMAGASYPGNFLPFLRWIDCKNYKKRAVLLFKNMDKLLEGMIEEHRNGIKELSLEGLRLSAPVLIFAGSDTSGVTIEWAMTLLLNHPHVLKKARDEIDTVIGQDRLVEESDLSKLTYLHNIILETFRLFPATPLLLPHQASANCKVGGYDIPAGTLVLVNSWSIHRDPKVWDDPTSFKPERFEGIEVETHKLMPFGMGRRSCPGNGLAHRVVGLVLASLIQCFDWERISDEQIDLTEGKGLTMPKAEPLEAMCKTRNVIDKVNI
ncbi:hypothetical protein AgCh_015519 [Apium graveolens]